MMSQAGALASPSSFWAIQLYFPASSRVTDSSSMIVVTRCDSSFSWVASPIEGNSWFSSSEIYNFKVTKIWLHARYRCSCGECGCYRTNWTTSPYAWYVQCCLLLIANLPILTMITVEGGLDDAVHLKVTVSPTWAVTFTGPWNNWLWILWKRAWSVFKKSFFGW